MGDLTDISGIGASTETKLRESGISSIEALTRADPEDLDEIGEAKSKKIIRRAQQEEITSKTAADLLDEYNDQEYVTTGIDEVDTMIGGGWEPETIGMVYGKSGTGKTQILFSSMGAASSEGSVVYLMTEIQSKSIADRLQALSNNVEDLSNIHIYDVHDVDEQFEAYRSIGEEFDEIDLFVIDSFTAQFRTNERFDGRENYGERSAVMGKHLREIGEMSRVFQCPVVMTGQVYESPEMFASPEDLYGGQKMEHFVSYFLRLSDSSGNLKEVGIENHPGIEESSLQIRIEDEEIVEVSE